MSGENGYCKRHDYVSRTGIDSCPECARLATFKHAVVEAAMAWWQAGGFLTAVATVTLHAACAELAKAEANQ